eukprot:Selendium_serpulae@DN6025_c0_g1_i4.p1
MPHGERGARRDPSPSRNRSSVNGIGGRNNRARHYSSWTAVVEAKPAVVNDWPRLPRAELVNSQFRKTKQRQSGKDHSAYRSDRHVIRNEAAPPPTPEPKKDRSENNENEVKENAAKENETTGACQKAPPPLITPCTLR